MRSFFLIALILAFAVFVTSMKAQEGDPPKTIRKELELATKEVKGAQEVMDARLADLQRATGEVMKPLKFLHPEDPKTGKLTIDAFQNVIGKHLEVADMLKKNKPDFDQAYARFLAHLESSPPAYRTLADAYERRGKEAAKQKGDAADFFSKEYFAWAKRCREVAASLEAQAKEWEKIHEKVEEKLRFVEQSTEFLADLAKFLSIYEKGVKNRDEVLAYLKFLDGYIDNFKLTIKAFEEFADKIKTPPSRFPPPMKISRDQRPGGPESPGDESLLTSLSDEPAVPKATTLTGTAESHYQAGQQAQSRGDLAIAEHHFRAALAAHQGNPDDAASYRIALASVLLAR